MNPFEDLDFRENIKKSYIIDLIINNNDYNIKEFNIKKCKNNIIIYSLKCDKVKYEYKFMVDEYNTISCQNKNKKNKNKNKLKINTSDLKNNKNNKYSAMSEDL